MAAEREIMVRKWKGRIGGPSMDTDLKKMAPGDAKQVEKDGRPQGADKRRGTPRAKNEQTTGDEGRN